MVLLTLPPLMTSVPLPPDPTSRLPLLAHVPLETVTLPVEPAEKPTRPRTLATRPPLTTIAPAPDWPIVRSVVLVHVPLAIVALPLEPAA